jgi:hypothetical protein
MMCILNYVEYLLDVLSTRRHLISDHRGLLLLKHSFLLTLPQTLDLLLCRKDEILKIIIYH